VDDVQRVKSVRVTDIGLSEYLAATVAVCKRYAELQSTHVVTATTVKHTSAKHRQGERFNIPPSEI